MREPHAEDQMAAGLAQHAFSPVMHYVLQLNVLISVLDVQKAVEKYALSLW
jgi:hypothetical protein